MVALDTMYLFMHSLMDMLFVLTVTVICTDDLCLVFPNNARVVVCAFIYIYIYIYIYICVCVCVCVFVVAIYFVCMYVFYYVSLGMITSVTDVIKHIPHNIMNILFHLASLERKQDVLPGWKKKLRNSAESVTN